MSIFAYFKKNLFLKTTTLLFLIILSNCVIADQVEKGGRSKAKLGFTPPPIPSVNTPEFKAFVRKYHTLPSPYGFEPYRERNNKEVNYLLSQLNPKNAYIPVTLYCNSMEGCPDAVVAAGGSMLLDYPNNMGNVEFGVKSSADLTGIFLGYYYPNDPQFYAGDIAVHFYEKKIKKGDPIVTILFSQRVLQKLSERTKGKLLGIFTANDHDIDLPSANGEELLTVGTTLSLIGLGEASGVEFSETVSQTTGETFTQQVQTGFTVNVGLEAQVTVGGGVVPTSESFKFSINESLSQMVSNGLEISNQQTVSRTYTIKPGINETYYWGIYQLLYSYRINAPLLEEVLKQIQSAFGDRISFRIGDNQVTQDGKLIGNPLPPQTSGLQNDVTVGVAVPVASTSKGRVFSQLMTPSH